MSDSERNFVCEFCGKKFKTACNLKTHVNSAMYCLKLRGENIVKPHSCDYCAESFTQKINLDKHIKICPQYKEYIELEKTKELESLKEKCQSNAKNVKMLKLVKFELSECKQKIKSLEKRLGETHVVEEEIHSEYFKKIEKIHSDNNSKLEKVRDEHTKIIKNIHDGTEKRIGKIEENHVSKIAALEKSFLSEKEKLKQEIIAKDKKISDLEKTIEFGKGVLVGYEKVKPPNVVTTNNTVVNQKLANLKVDNIRPLTIGTIIEDIPNYTFDMYMGAETGIVQFMKHLTQLEMEDGSIEINYACTDKSRSTFHRLMESKEWKHDGGSKFINDVFDNLAEKSIEHWDTLISLSKNPDILEQHYYTGKMVEMTSFQSSFTSKGKHREEYFNKVKSKMKDVSSV
jgi:hypothetical protein